MIKLRYFIAVCIVFFMIGCANNMALTKGQDNVDISKKSIALLSVNIANQKRTGYQPSVLRAFIKGTGTIQYKADPPYKSEKDSFNEFLLSFDRDPGINNLSKFIFLYDSFPIGAQANLPLDLEVDIKPNSVNYLGHMYVVIREKKNNDEESAGLIFPLIDQAVTGFYSGTFDVNIEDKFDEDMKWFLSEYPGLEKVKVVKSILPQWIRPENRSK
jgi:hypothetical protein